MGGLTHDNNDIVKLSKRYFRQSVWLTAGMTLVGLLVMNVFRIEALLTPIVVSAVFSIVIETADTVVWQMVARRNPEGLTSFYTVSGFRMLAALATMMVYYLVVGSDAMLVFFLVFMSFYVLLLIHHTTFFARISNRS